MKTVYLSFLLHGNMCYDRYTKQEIREKFALIYAAGVRAMGRHPEVTAHIDFPGLTLLSLKHHAPWFLEELRPLVDRGQVVMVGCQYAASHSLCSGEEAELRAARLTMDLMREEYGPGVDSFFPQEVAWHPQLPWMMNQVGVRRLLVMPTGWPRPRRLRGLEGSVVTLCPLHFGGLSLEGLEAYYDAQEDGAFAIVGTDFEGLGSIEAWVEAIAALATKGKLIEWSTVDRYEQEVGVTEEVEAFGPCGQAREAVPHGQPDAGRDRADATVNRGAAPAASARLFR
jgi:hypothetical protein